LLRPMHPSTKIHRRFQGVKIFGQETFIIFSKV
jgi:hypothetical protein